MPFRKQMHQRQTRDVDTRTSHPGRGASIDDIFAIYDKAELGLLRDLHDLYDDIADKDLTLSSLAETRAGAILGCKVVLSPGGPDPEDERLVREFSDMLDRHGIDFYDLVDHHQYSTLFYGYAATELIWKRARGRYEIVAIVQPRSRSFRVATEINRWLDGASLDELLIQTDDYGTRFERLIPNKWLITRRMGRKKIIAHSGMMYQTSPMSAMKMDVSIDWVAFIERFGIPFPVATISSWNDERAAEAAERSIATMGTTHGLIVTENDGFRLDIHDGAAKARTANSDVHSRFAVFANIEMAKFWTGGYLVAEQGASAGSYAQAAVHGKREGNLTDHDKSRTVRSIRRLAQIYRDVNELPGRLPNAALYPSQVSAGVNVPKMAKEMEEAGAPVESAQLYELTSFRPAKKERASA